MESFVRNGLDLFTGVGLIVSAWGMSLALFTAIWLVAGTVSFIWPGTTVGRGFFGIATMAVNAIKFLTGWIRWLVK